mmetsp:Transcript_13325/g.53453  ORF Transcript_13325/g.53453 Transcript_13325/m.53453 type:complete len:214 (-) Transcript_13325:245-886(-)
MSTSRSASTRFQNPTTASSSVHSRTTTQHGKSLSGRSASSTEPSDGSPSDAMTTNARVPAARSCDSRARMSRMTSRTRAQSGVRPSGELAARCFMASISRSGSPRPTGTTCGAPAGGLSSRNSVGAPRCAATAAWNSSESPSSSQRVADTAPQRPWPALTKRRPSHVFIDPELSMIQYRMPNCATDLRNCSTSPAGPMCAPRRKYATLSASDT